MKPAIVFQAVMRSVVRCMTAVALVIVVMTLVVVVSVAMRVVMGMGVDGAAATLLATGRDRRRRRLVHTELRRRHAGAQHAFGRHRAVLDRQAAKRGAQAVDRQTEIEQRAEEHVARSAGETVDVCNA